MRTKQIDKYNKAEKLRNLRLSYGLSQKEFGQKLGLTRELIASYELGHNPVSLSTILKISQVTGIGREYFESEMSLQEALKKYEITPIDMIQTGDFDDIGFFVYEGIMSYINNEPIKQKMTLKLRFLTLLFGLDTKADHHFIKLTDSANEPYAKRGDILAVLKDDKAVNGDFVIARFQQNHIIFQYFIAGLDEALFKGNNDIEIKLKGKEIEQIEILGIIKQKISISM
ncbi:helix-turn-helix domain-containing protein [uncultured Helicobacter sp.]|uniref:helix-turn-helix domain-containing protein n=1 Tax=uncultured Helicobacter sp. TaxID=175537 RepID=UPI003750B905